ncbi:MAG: FtsX-like permease family protein [Vallitalea sp.]|nr:FtsX-like permease family protein [Vallitalea sp.]
MKLVKIPIKYIKSNKLRSFSLGFFIMLSTIIFILFNSMVDTVNSNMEAIITRAITGDIVIRPSESEEKEMISYTSLWANLPSFGIDETNNIVEKLQSIDDILYEKRVRGSLVMINDTQQVPTLFVGVDTNASSYNKALNLKLGRLLVNNSEKSIVIPTTLSNQLNVAIGDTVECMISTAETYNTIELEVVGIVDIALLNMFGVEPIYMGIDLSRQLLNLEENSATDIMIYSEGKSQEKLLSNIRQHSSKVSTWKDVSGAIIGGLTLYISMFYGFLAILLFIIALLMTNMVFMMGYERRRDIGTLKAIGYSKWKIVTLFMEEIVLLSSLSSVIGCIIGSIISYVLSNTVVQIGAPLNIILGNEFTLNYKPLIIIPVFFIMFVFSTIVSFYPSYKLSLLNPADTVREN